MRKPKHRGWSNAEHGTNAGYQHHMYWQTAPCEPCRLAKREYNRVAQRRWRAEQAEKAAS